VAPAGFYAAALLLASSFRRLSGSNAAGGLLLVLLLGNGQVIRLSFMIMTESLFLSCFMLLLALFCRLVREPGWQALALASLVAGLAVLIRPAGYALLVSLPLVAWWSWRGGVLASQAVFATVLPCVLILGAGMAAYHSEHGLWRTQTFSWEAYVRQGRSHRRRGATE
jgi:4-amino-4-deoxy-L-arabinose transferase-like glycosyltransferase